MSRPRLLDLFCGAGGAAMGYHRAGFDVVGVDIAAQPRFPFEFHRADALSYPLAGFDVIHASPPCQAYSRLKTVWKNCSQQLELIEPVRDRLTKGRKRRLYVIENVVGAPLRRPLTLCGTEFSLNVRVARDGRMCWLSRHRLFESNVTIPRATGCRCTSRPVIGVYGHGRTAPTTIRGTQASVAEATAVMGIDWMNRDELAQAIPPAYTEYIGRWLLASL